MLHFVKDKENKVHAFSNKKDALKFHNDYNKENGAFASDYGNENDGFLEANHDLIMKQIAETTGLNFDGSHSSDNKETRLFADDEYYRQMNIVSMGRETYEAWENKINNTTTKGKGFIVYSWNDCSGFDYWLGEGVNYQQITVNIEHVGKALLNVNTIMDKVDQYEASVSEFSCHDIEYAGFPTNEEIEAAQNEIGEVA